MSAKEKRVKLVIAWHMHQPYYFNSKTDQYQLPWTYLHAIKDYVDMANIIAKHPKAKSVVNFAPILLEQLQDYADQINNFFNDGETIKDPLLMLLVSKEIPEDKEQKLHILNACLRANEKYLIDRYKPFRILADIAKQALQDNTCLLYLNNQFYFDLLVWYHIAWLGETVKRNNAFIEKLISQKSDFGVDDRHQFLMLIRDLIGSIVPKYKALSEKGQVELAFSPYAHPIIPLMIDFESAKDAIPDVSLPKHKTYPGGTERANTHFATGLKVFERYFGFTPKGCWPSEGSVSDETVQMCEKHGIDWAASGENVMRSSIQQTPALHGLLENQCLHRSYALNGCSTRLFFRDDGLSDLIGFNYSTWHSDDAVNNLIHHVENIAKACEFNGDTVISIILDGENAWEHYPENGFHFLDTLYKKLGSHSKIELTTFSECLENNVQAAILDKVVSGSWVYGTFSTWIGDPEKNKGWELLIDAKQAYDEVVNSGALSSEQLTLAEKQLAICEGSDWFWWFGDYNPSDSVKDFDQLYRIQLSELYRRLNLQSPSTLNQPISAGGGSPATGGVMRPGQEGHPY